MANCAIQMSTDFLRIKELPFTLVNVFQHSDWHIRVLYLIIMKVLTDSCNNYKEKLNSVFIYRNNRFSENWPIIGDN
jgi:hypothetical protein